jgi:NADPH2:quinone reductase
MKAAILNELGGVPQVGEVETPSGPHVVEVLAATLNPVDIAIGNGRFYGGSPDPPYVIGGEAVGRTADGRRVWFRGSATIAEYAVAPPDQSFEVPDGVADAVAVACGIAGLTGWLAVSWRTRVTPDDTVLVLGASGTLGATAVQGAKVLGARTVVGAARRVDAIPDGADDKVELTGDYELPEATVIVDALWGEPAERALAAAARGARIVQLGQSAGPEAKLQSAWVRGKQLNIHGFSVFAAPRDVLEEGYRELCEHARDGRIEFAIEQHPIEDVAAAWERQASGSPGAKIVITP